MKTLICLLFTVNMMASASPDHISTFYYDPSVTISFENWKGKDLHIKIVSEENEIIFDDRLDTRKSDGVKYNLRNLTSGKYMISLEDEIKRVEETLILFDGKIVEKEEKVYFKPMITEMEGRVKINFLSTTGNTEVKIFDQDGIIHEEVFEGEFPLMRYFNLTALNPGDYTFMVSDEYISKSIRIKR